MRRALCIALLALLGACRSKGGLLTGSSDGGSAATFGVSPPPSPPVPRPPPSAPGDHRRELVAEACLACHSEEILLQQRLTAVQWEKVVKKMAGWGANIAADDVPVVAAYLSERCGLDAGPYEVGLIGPAQAAGEIAPLDDGAFAGGSADGGGALYAARCAACHGADARGQIGVNLVDRPLLYRAADFVRAVRDGRAKMPAQPSTTDGELADLLAHLRRVRPSR